MSAQDTKSNQFMLSIQNQEGSDHIVMAEPTKSGLLAWHPMLCEDNDGLHGWSITHVPSGLALAKYLTQSEAAQVAESLDAHADWSQISHEQMEELHHVFEEILLSVCDCHSMQELETRTLIRS